MSGRRSFVFRILAEILVGLLVAGAFVGASHDTTGTGFITTGIGLLIAAGLAGYLELSAKRVWLHPLFIMWPELVALPFAILTCHGFECGGMIAFLALASLFTLFLIGLAFAGFYLRYRITRSGHKVRDAAVFVRPFLMSPARVRTRHSRIDAVDSAARHVAASGTVNLSIS